jgi:hypothetical protein
LFRLDQSAWRNPYEWNQTPTRNTHAVHLNQYKLFYDDQLYECEQKYLMELENVLKHSLEELLNKIWDLFFFLFLYFILEGKDSFSALSIIN